MTELHKAVEQMFDLSNTSLLTENANKDARIIPTQRDLLAGSVSRAYALERILPKHIADAHVAGILHFHDLDYSPFFPMFNCFHRDTAFITSNGVKTFADFADGDVVVVPTHTGNWKSAVVRSYGKQNLNKVTLKRGTGFKEVIVTENHRWILKDGSSTTNLQVGDTLVRTPKLDIFDLSAIDADDAKYWVMGFVFGDGSRAKSNNGKESSRVRICA